MFMDNISKLIVILPMKITYKENPYQDCVKMVNE